MVRIVSLLFLAILCGAALTLPASALDAISSCRQEAGNTDAYVWKYREIAGKHCWYIVGPRDSNATKVITRKVFKHFWTGPYAGAHVGYGFFSLNGGPTPFAGISPPGGIDANSGIIGGHAGARIRFNQWMLGAEFQADYMNARAVDWDALTYNKLEWTTNENIQFGRVFQPFWMGFVGIGPAQGSKTTLDLITGDTIRKQLFGFNAEVGTQVALGDNVAAGITYQWYRFDDHTTVSAIKFNVDWTWINIYGNEGLDP